MSYYSRWYLGLGRDLERIAHWAATWRINFNPNKNEAMPISRKIHKINHPAMYFNQIPIEKSSNSQTPKISVIGRPILSIFRLKLGLVFIY